MTRACRPFPRIFLLVVAATLAGLLLTENASGSPSEPLHIVLMPQVDGDEPRTIDVDASTVTGQIRSLQGLNAGPRPPFPWMADLTDQYSAIGVDFVRTHDYFGPCDMNEIFPNWDADPTLESSYDFASTDQELAAIQAAGADILFRLGYSWGDPTAPVTYIAPEDQAKWAEIARHIVMHYNDGWASGFYYDIRYWEVWNEPDIPIFWTGTPDEYFQLYQATAQALKTYDSTLRVGGPALCCNWEFLAAFLAYAEANSVPLDFISWHTYTPNPYDPYVQAEGAQYLRELFGFPDAELILDEWNYFPGAVDENWNAKGAAYTASFLAYMQDTPIAISGRYRGNGGGPGGTGMGLFNDDGIYKKPAYTYLAHRWLLDTPLRLAATGSDSEGYTVLAGKSADDEAITIIISDLQSSHTGYTLTVDNLPWGNQPFLHERYLLDADHDLQLVGSEILSGTPVFSTIEAMSAESLQVVKLTRTAYAIDDVETWVTALNGNQLYTRILQPDPALYPGQRFPAVILVPGGLGAGAPLADSPLYRDLAASGFVVVAFNAEGRGNGLPGNLQSEGTEDCNGFVHQDDLKAIIEYTAALPNVDVTNIGVQTSSYGITMGAGALGRYPDLPVAYLIDAEGPHDNRVTTHYDVGSEHDLCGHWSLMTDPSPENEAWWAEREAIRYIDSYPGIYLRMQAEVDHAQGSDYFRHAIEMVNAATRPQYLGTGSTLWTRMNGDDMGNPINTVYPLGDPGQHPTWVSGRLSDYPELAAVYIQEVAALVNSGDNDGDGFSDIEELYVTTDRFDACPDDPSDDAWPPDMNRDTDVNVLDVLLYKPKLVSAYDRRYDLNTDGTVNILDVLLCKPVMGMSCTSPPP